ncbi:Protein SEY1-like protein [Frankliniella fusca]|uniref:Protein SEY1-like protein n=1 Tax=Frankliniella fusca TaxID=407009 RepID=A0AAE1HD75_9NEOP|nr:Protein SEY1-like protein [Frankliniella fusca]
MWLSAHSAEPVYLPPCQGGAGLLPLNELTDLCTITHAFRLLTCPDPIVQDTALSGARITTKRKIKTEPTIRSASTLTDVRTTPSTEKTGASQHSGLLPERRRPESGKTSPNFNGHTRTPRIPSKSRSQLRTKLLPSLMQIPGKCFLPR